METTKVDILALGAHPDDVECSAAGVILKHIAMGRTVAIADLTAGETGNYGDAESRKHEAESASEILGIKYREQLGLPDGALENNETSRLKLIYAIRTYRPEIVLCNAVYDRHPDHSVAAKLAADACYLSGLKKKETFIDGVAQDAWRPKAVYHYVQDFYIEPDFVTDISEYMDKKIEAILAFRSQFSKSDISKPNSNLGLIDHIKSTNSLYGSHINAAYAEGFTVNRYLGVNDLFQII